MHWFRWFNIRFALGPTLGSLVLLWNAGHAFAFEKSAPAKSAALSIRSTTATHAKMDAGLRMLVDAWTNTGAVAGTASLRRSEALTQSSAAFSVLASPRGGDSASAFWTMPRMRPAKESPTNSPATAASAPAIPAPANNSAVACAPLVPRSAMKGRAR